MPLTVAQTSPKRLPAFIKRQPFMAIMLTWIFIASAVLISLLCVAAATVIWPFSKKAYRVLVSKLNYLLVGRTP